MICKIKKALKPYRWLYYMLSRGLIEPEELWSSRMSFSQFGEDMVLRSYFERINKGQF
jgi:hypothetical protein